MASVIKKYPLGENRFLYGYMEGFALLGDGALTTTSQGERHICFLSRVDSGQKSCKWGRLRFSASLNDDAIPVLHAFATDDEELVADGVVRTYDSIILSKTDPVDRKLKLFKAAGAMRFMGKTDMLLYGQEGQYLWLCIEIIGSGGAKLRDFEAFAPGDNFFNTFPEIYRTDGEFFHRYLSVFSSLYYDLQDTIDSLDQYLDIDTAPDSALPIFAGWLGIETDGGFLDGPHLRKLLKAAFALIRDKGTRRAVEGIIRVFTDEPIYIVEQHAVMEITSGKERHVCERLYGRSPFDFTVLLRQTADERLHAQLKYLVRQFTLLRCRINIVFLEDAGRLDGYTYSDINARVAGAAAGELDGGSALNGLNYLS